MAAIVDRLVLQAAEKLPGTDNEDGVCIACAETARVSDWDVTVSRVEDGLTGWRPLLRTVSPHEVSGRWPRLRPLESEWKLQVFVDGRGTDEFIDAALEVGDAGDQFRALVCCGF